LAKEIRFQIWNSGGIGEHPTLRRVHRRFRQGLERKGCRVCSETECPVSARERAGV